MSDPKMFIATKFAVKEIGFRPEERNNQERLKLLWNRTQTKLEAVEESVNSIRKAVIAENPELAQNQNLDTIILGSLKQKVSDDEVTSLEQIQDVQVLGKITEEVVFTAKNSQEAILMNSTGDTKTSLANTLIAGYSLSQILNSDMSTEELMSIQEKFNNSAEVQARMLDLEEKFKNGKSEEERRQAAQELSVKKYKPQDSYFIKNKGTCADRGSIIIVAQKYLEGGELSKKEALLKAKMYGLDTAITPQGEIDMNSLFELMKQSVAGVPKLEERFSTVDKFVSEVRSIIERRTNSYVKKAEKDKANGNIVRESGGEER